MLQQANYSTVSHAAYLCATWLELHWGWQEGRVWQRRDAACAMTGGATHQQQPCAGSDGAVRLGAALLPSLGHLEGRPPLAGGLPVRWLQRGCQGQPGFASAYHGETPMVVQHCHSKIMGCCKERVSSGVETMY
jgi:hypothetical protein